MNDQLISSEDKDLFGSPIDGNRRVCVMASLMKPSLNLKLINEKGLIGKLDFTNPTLVFTGDAEESAKLFIDWAAKLWKARLEEERTAEREACAKVCEDYTDRYAGCEDEGHGYEIAAAIRARGET